MPSATGQNWEKYQKKFADDEVEEKKIVPLSEEYVPPPGFASSRWDGMEMKMKMKMEMEFPILTAPRTEISRYSKPMVLPPTPRP